MEQIQIPFSNRLIITIIKFDRLRYPLLKASFNWTSTSSSRTMRSSSRSLLVILATTRSAVGTEPVGKTTDRLPDTVRLSS